MQCTRNFMKYLKEPCIQRCFSSKMKTYKMSPEALKQKVYSEQAAYLSDVIEKSKTLSSSDWDSLCTETLAMGKQISNENISATIIGFCTAHKQLNLAASFIKHLEQSNKPVNFATRSKFLRLCYEMSPTCDEEIIIENYKILRAQLPVMDASTSENVIVALSATSQWQEGLQLKDAMNLTCTPGVIVYTSLIKAAFIHGEEETGWKLVEEAIGANRKPRSEIYSVWLQYCKNNKSTLQTAETLLKFIARHDIILPQKVVIDLKVYMEHCLKPEWKGKLTTVSSNGICKACGETLQPINLTEDQFHKLRSNFLEKVVLGRDVFTRSTPEEINAFQTFLQQSHSYDVVIDGLNVGFTAASAGKNSHRIFSTVVRSVVEQFIHQGMSVMVLGRKHMLQWPRKDMEYIKKNSKLFLASNLSQDDPLLLYATLHGGPNTYFVSRDLMRGHAFRLKNAELSNLFRRWQQWRQYQAHFSKYTGRVSLTPPLSYLPCAQQKEVNGHTSSWHVPYQEVEDESTVILEVPSQWLCLNTR